MLFDFGENWGIAGVCFGEFVFNVLGVVLGSWLYLYVVWYCMECVLKTRCSVLCVFVII